MYDVDREHIGDLKYLGNLLAETRFEKHLSQRQVALYADISNTELYRLEKGERQKPSPKILKKLSEILNIPYEWLLQYAGYLDLQDDTISKNITINYNSLSSEERDFILNYLCKKWNEESPDRDTKYTKEEIENILFEKKESLEFKDIKNSNTQFYMCPVYGKISAGQPNWAEECLDGYLPIDPELMNIVNPEECFFLRVNGESMNKVIKNGAYALIRKTDFVKNGEIAIVLVNGYDATIKKFTKQGDVILLEPMSDDPTITTQIYTKDTPIKVIGKYIGKMEFNN